MRELELEKKEEIKMPLAVLEELADKVFNHHLDDMGLMYYVAFGQVIYAFVDVGAFKSMAELDKAFEMQNQLEKLFPEFELSL